LIRSRDFELGRKSRVVDLQSLTELTFFVFVLKSLTLTYAVVFCWPQINAWSLADRAWRDGSCR